MIRWLIYGTVESPASSLYGSLASLFLLLLWLRFIVMILFAGGVLNRTLEEEKTSEN